MQVPPSNLIPIGLALSAKAKSIPASLHVTQPHGGDIVHLRFGSEPTEPPGEIQPSNGPAEAKTPNPDAANGASGPQTTGPQTVDGQAPTSNGPAAGETEPTSSQTPTEPAKPLTTWGKLKAVFNFLKTLPQKYKACKEFFSSDNATVAKGLFFKQIVPLLLTLGAFVPGYGIIIALAGMPLSYFSGRYGAKVLEEMKKKNESAVSDALENVTQIDELLSGSRKGSTPTEIIDRINKAIDDALDIKRFPFLGRFIQFLKPTPTNFMGRVLTHWGRFALLANINTNIAKEDSVMKATYAGVKGSFNFLLWYTILPKIGQVLDKGSKFMWPPFSWMCKGLGLLLEYAGVLQLAKDMAFTGNPQAGK